MVLGSELGLTPLGRPKKFGKEKAWRTAMSRSTRNATDSGHHVVRHGARHAPRHVANMHGNTHGAPHGRPRSGLHPWRFAWRVTWCTTWKTATHGKSCGVRCGGPPSIFFLNCRLRGGAPRSLQDWVYRTYFLLFWRCRWNFLVF